MKRRYALILAGLMLGGCDSPDKSWQLAERDDTPAAYLEFLAKYPDGEKADQARTRLEVLKAIRAWERAEFKADERSYQNFIKKFPSSEFAATAEQRILVMRREVDWQVALDSRGLWVEGFDPVCDLLLALCAGKKLTPVGVVARFGSPTPISFCRHPLGNRHQKWLLLARNALEDSAESLGHVGKLARIAGRHR